MGVIVVADIVAQLDRDAVCSDGWVKREGFG